MRNQRIQGRVTAGRWTLPVIVFLCTACWVLIYLLFPHLSPTREVEVHSPFWPLICDILSPAWADRLASFLVYAFTGYLLIELNNRFAIIRMRASMQTAVYLLLVLVCPELYPLNTGSIAALAGLISIHFLFGSYQQPQASGSLFYSFLFIGIGSLFFPQLSVLALLWLPEAARFRSLSPRSFFGALLGWALPYWFLFGHAFYHDRMDLFYLPFTELATPEEVFDLASLQTWELGILGYLLILFVISLAHCAIAGFEDKIRTRAYLQFLIDLSLFLFLLIALQPAHCGDLLPLLMISSSILIGHFFVLTDSKTSNVLFVLAMLGLICLLAFNVWTLL